MKASLYRAARWWARKALINFGGAMLGFAALGIVVLMLTVLSGG